MGFDINPANRKGAELSVSRSEKVGKGKKSTVKDTASKVGEIVQLPVMKESREVRILSDARELAKRIRRDWNVYHPSELAEQIVDLEGKVALLEGTSPAIDRIKKVAERLHFQFVFPIVLELSQIPDPKMPTSFARVIHNAAKQVLETQSWESLKQFNAVQVEEFFRYARGGA